VNSDPQPITPTINDRPIRVVVAGAGAMGMAWLRAVGGHPDLELAGIVDRDPRRAKGAAIRLRQPGLPLAATIGELGVAADACVNVTPPAAHHEVTAAALRAGLPVLTEKPFAATMAEALELSRLARAHQRLLMVAQTRHYEAGLAQLRGLSARLGSLNLVTTEFRRAYRAAGFRLTMSSPLLLDMAVHAFDAARFLIGTRPSAVYAAEFNPPHSWFRDGGAAVVTVEFSDAVRYCYTGSWCAAGAQTSWSGSWRVDGELGSCAWSGDSAPSGTVGDADAGPGTEDEPDAAADPVRQVAAPLAEFVAALRTGARPWGEAADNLLTFAMVQAAILSARRREPVAIDELLDPHAGTA
jgi:predicted dehydrogenase